MKCWELTVPGWAGEQHPAVDDAHVGVGPAGRVGFEVFYLFYDFKPRNHQPKDNVHTAERECLQSTKRLWVIVVVFQLISHLESQSVIETLSSQCIK